MSFDVYHVVTTLQLMSRYSTIERTINRCVTVIFATLFLLVTLSDGLGFVEQSKVENRVTGQLVWYLGGPNSLADASYLPPWLSNWFPFLILYTNFLPISLYVTVEICNFFHAAFIASDRAMYDPRTDTAARVRTSSLCQVLR